ncbi:MAG: LysM domain-containing protein [Nanoarchaeota archaeon]
MKTLPKIILATGLTLLSTEVGKSGVRFDGNDFTLTGQSYDSKGGMKFDGAKFTLDKHNDGENPHIITTEYKGVTLYENTTPRKGDSTKITHLYHIVVQKGDNLSVIADRINNLNRMRSEHPFPNKISWVDIYNGNYSNPLQGGEHISNPDIIYPGQEIRFSLTHQIPNPASHSSPNVIGD